jgi:hypothetical protein
VEIGRIVERLLQPDRIVAVGLLTQRELGVLGPTFDRAWPIEQAPRFDDLLRAIDEAERRLRNAD